MISTPDVAIVLHFRTPQRTLACLASLRAEGIGQVELVDNSEDDGASLADLQPGLEALRDRGLQVCLHCPGRNLGFAAAVNLALEHVARTRPSSVLLINSDARLLPGALEALKGALGEGSGLAVPASPGRAPRGYHRWLALTLPAWIPGVVSYPSGACILLTAPLASWLRLDEEFFFYAEDVALGASLRKRGISTAYAPSARVEHEGSGSARNGSLFYEYHVARGHWVLASKLTRSRAGYMLALAGRMLVLPARAVFRAVRSRSWVPLAALAMATLDISRGRRRSLTPPVEPQRAASATFGRG